MTTHPVTVQPRGGSAAEHLVGFHNHWQTDLFSSVKQCPDCLIACCCCCWYMGVVTQRAGENFWAGCCCSSAALLAVRTKIRGAFKIQDDLCLDVCVTSCCGVCAAIQTKKELDHQGIPGLGPTWLGNK